MRGEKALGAPVVIIIGRPDIPVATAIRGATVSADANGSREIHRPRTQIGHKSRQFGTA